MTMCSGFYSFKDAAGNRYGSFEVFYDGPDIPKWGSVPRNYNAQGEPVEAGWYWHACFPGCLPDGDAHGPFNTSELAYQDAMGEQAHD